jgi:hypothetical protein
LSFPREEKKIGKDSCGFLIFHTDMFFVTKEERSSGLRRLQSGQMEKGKKEEERSTREGGKQRRREGEEEKEEMMRAGGGREKEGKERRGDGGFYLRVACTQLLQCKLYRSLFFIFDACAPVARHFWKDPKEQRGLD